MFLLFEHLTGGEGDNVNTMQRYILVANQKIFHQNLLN